MIRNILLVIGVAMALFVLDRQAEHIERQHELIDILAADNSVLAARIRLLEYGLELQCPSEFYEEREI